RQSRQVSGTIRGTAPGPAHDSVTLSQSQSPEAVGGRPRGEMGSRRPGVNKRSMQHSIPKLLARAA
ncbi:hypothetical protein JMJ77_0014521, partial [Colletotrichum scovillei]